MSERRNTLLCCFDPASPRLTAYDIHEWIHSQLQVLEHSVSMIQIDGIRRQVYIKFFDLSSVHDILSATNGETVYKHVTGEISPVKLVEAGMGSKRVRLANLPPEVSNNNVRVAMSNFGTVHAIQEETWAKHYRYNVSNGVKIVTMTLTKHIPSYVVIDGHRALTSYDGQPQTCYGCGETAHMYHACPKRRVAKAPTPATAHPTWAAITAATAPAASNPGVPANDNMLPDPYPPPTLTVTRPPVDDTTEKMETAPSNGQPTGQEDSPAGAAATSSQAPGPLPSSKWADEISDLDITPSVAPRPSGGTPTAVTDWPPLPAMNMEKHGDTGMHPTCPPCDGGDDKSTTNNDDLATPSDSTDTQDVATSATVRKKKMRLEKSRAASREGKRSRPRQTATVKDKH